ncbi:MAG TPA: hypothetical protein VIJ47_04365 [Acidimicrobiales bacterium]
MDLVDARAHLAAGLAVLDSSPWAWPVAAAGLFALGLIVHFPIFTSPVLDVDEATVGSIAQEILRGRHLYGDLVDRKPPLLFILYALSFVVVGGGSLLPIRLMMVALEVATGLLIAATLCTRWRDRLVIAGLFVAGTATFPLADAHAASFEAYLILPMTLAWWFSRKGRAIPAGVALVVSTLVKQSAVFTMIPVLYNLWRQPNGPRKAGVMMATFAGLYLAVGSSFGLRQFLFWNLTGNASYLGASSLMGMAGRALLTLGCYGVSHLVLVWLTARGWPERRVHLDLWLWLGSAFVGVLIGQHFFGHYYLQVLPPLAAVAATQVGRLDRSQVRRAVGATVAITALWLGITVFVLPRPDLPPYVRLVEQIDHLSGPDEPILVWGVFSEATWASDRPMASRFPHTNFVTGVDQGRPTPGALAELCADLEQRPPRLIIDTSPANVRDSGKAPIREVPEMASVLASYRRAADVNDIVIYQLAAPSVSCGTDGTASPSH